MFILKIFAIMIKSFFKAALAGLIAFAIAFGAFALFMWMSNKKDEPQEDDDQEDQEEEKK